MHLLEKQTDVRYRVLFSENIIKIIWTAKEISASGVRKINLFFLWIKFISESVGRYILLF